MYAFPPIFFYISILFLIEFMYYRYQVVIFASLLLVSVTAFAPVTKCRTSTVSMMAERSKSVPFLLKPAKLDGSLAGDEGFDPLGLSNIDDLGVG